MKKLVALKKFKFRGVTLYPQDEFFAKDVQARVLCALKSAKAAPPDDYAPLTEPLDNPKAELREEYMRVIGKRPFNGWDEEKLREKISTYQTRDMVAQR